MAQASQFYITLPSNARVEGNKIGNYSVQLPYPIELEGEWMVGLAEIQYPVTYNTVRGCNMSIFMEDGKSIVEPINDGYYETIQELIDSLNYAALQYIVYRREVSKKWTTYMRNKLADKVEKLKEFEQLMKDLDKTLHFDYIKVLRRVRVTIHPTWTTHVVLNPQLQHILGMEHAMLGGGETLGKYPPDLKGGMSNLFVYCNLISPQLVGGTRTNLLKVVPLQGQPGDIVAIDFPNIHYGELITNRFSTIEISIKASSGETIEFNFGNVLVKLHLKKRQLL